MDKVVMLLAYFLVGSVIGVVGQAIGASLWDTVVAGIALIAALHIVVLLWLPPAAEDADEDH